MTRSSKWSLPFNLCCQNFVWLPHLHSCHVICTSYSLWSTHPNNIWWSVKVTKLLIMHSSPVS